MASNPYDPSNEKPRCLSSSSSTITFDFTLLLDESDPQLLSESLTMDSISTVSSTETLPDFPSGRTVPVSTIVVLGDDFPTFTLRRGGFSKSAEQMKAIITIPTAPRLNMMPSVNVFVNNWVNNLMETDAPEHVPWGELAPTKQQDWVREGSVYAHEKLVEVLSTARRRRLTTSGGRLNLAPATHTPAPVRASGRRRASEYPMSFRKALVFEREITLDTGGKTKRWSLQVPATTMNPEMVDMMLELQDLNTFFKDGLQDLDQSVAALGQEKSKLDPPSLVISDSHSTIPLLLESPAAENLTPDFPVTLAARRGKGSLPTLSFEQGSAEIAYPNIPTPFLGSPSAYSPEFEYANAVDDPSLDFEDMIAGLRSQCASMQSYSRQTSHASIKDILAREPSLLSANSFSPVGDDDDGDDWAFAVSLLDELSSSTDLGKATAISDDQYPAPETPNRPDKTGAGNSQTVNASAPGIDVERSGRHRDRGNKGTSSSPKSPVPSTPLPPHPLLVNVPTPGVRSILKSSKNVRFASLPCRPQSAESTGPTILTPRHSTGSPIVTPLRRPSTLRNTYSATPTPVANGTLSSTTPRPVSHHVHTPSRVGRPLSVPPSTTQAKTPATGNQLKSSPRSFGRQSTLSSKKGTPVSLGRHSLGRAVKADAGKENEPTSPQTPTPTTSRWTLNENTFRRGSTASPPSGGTPKSRMPVPLRNILTRFK